MKILLTAVNAKYIHSNLAIYSLRAAAGSYKEHVELAEYTINNAKDAILSDLYKRKPDVLCFSCYIWNLEYLEDLIGEFHKLCPKVPIWVGGPEVSYEVEEFLLKHPGVFGVMIGEGEQTFYRICQYYIDKREDFDRLEKISGLAFRNEKGICFTKPREVVSLSSLPFCYEEMDEFANRIIYYESSRGCPFSCSYCLSSVDKKLRFRDPELVKKELKFFIEKEVPQVKFVDRTFNCNHNHAMEIWSFIKENDRGITNFHFEISADLLKEEEIQLLQSMRPGLVQLEIGVQSTNEATLWEIHRSMKLQRLKEVVMRIGEGKNIHQHLDLIAGLPYEGYLSFQNSFDEIYALRPNQLQLGFLKILKGSYMYEHVKEYGIVYHDKPPYEVLYTNWLSYDEVMKIKKVEEMVEVYYNSGQYQIAMSMLSLLVESPFAFFQKLGDFYEERGYLDKAHTRIRRCEILLEFISEQSPIVKIGGKALLEEALVLDLYYRENCKTRPDFAVDMQTFKDVTRKFCQKGKLSHVEPFHYRFLQEDGSVVNELPERLDKEVYLLFDYEKRNPLDHQAMACYVF